MLVSVFARNTKGVEDEENKWITIEALFIDSYEKEGLESVVNNRKTVVWNN